VSVARGAPSADGTGYNDDLVSHNRDKPLSQLFIRVALESSRCPFLLSTQAALQ
jgi:hypothetical protein